MIFRVRSIIKNFGTFDWPWYFYLSLSKVWRPGFYHRIFVRPKWETGVFVLFCLYITSLLLVFIGSWVYTSTLSKVPVALYLTIVYSLLRQRCRHNVGVWGGVRRFVVDTPFKRGLSNKDLTFFTLTSPVGRGIQETVLWTGTELYLVVLRSTDLPFL